MAKSILKRLSTPFLFACLIGLIYNIIMIVITSYNSAVSYPIELWLYSGDLFVFTYPIFCSVPFCWLLYYERKNGYLNFVHSRISLKKYLSRHYLCGEFLTFVCIFFISFSGLIIALYFVEPQIVMPDNYENVLGNLFGTVQINQPLLYGFLLSIWRGFIGSLMYTFSFLLSLISNHLFVILTGSFIYSILENFLTGIIQYSIFSICTSFYPDRMNWEAFSADPLLALAIGPIVLIVICILLLGYIVWSRRKENGEIKN